MPPGGFGRQGRGRRDAPRGSTGSERREKVRADGAKCPPRPGRELAARTRAETPRAAGSSKIHPKFIRGLRKLRGCAEKRHERRLWTCAVAILQEKPVTRAKVGHQRSQPRGLASSILRPRKRGPPSTTHHAVVHGADEGPRPETERQRRHSPARATRLGCPGV